jgi:hypothetical protein
MSERFRKKNEATKIYNVPLIDSANRPSRKSSATLAAGDVKLYQGDDGSAVDTTGTNIGTLPTEQGSSGLYCLTLTAAEMNYDNISVELSDAAGAEWDDQSVVIRTRGIDLDDLQEGFFADGTVWVDPTGTNSTAWPYGSAPYPTSTIANGKTIADALNIQRINITGTISLVAAMENYQLVGSGNIDVAELVDINSQSIEHSTLRKLTVTGIGGNAATIADQTRYSNCLIYAHTNIQGVVEGGSIGGACSIRDTGYAVFTDVFFGQGAACTLTLQAPTKCDIINMRGVVTLSGMDGGVCNVTLTDGSSVTIDNTCTAGTITLTGIGSVTDNSNGSTVVALADTPTVLHAATDALLNRVLGLQKENSYIHTTTFDANDRLLTAQIDLYDSKANADTHDGSTGIVAKYTYTATYDADGMATEQCVRDS